MALAACSSTGSGNKHSATTDVSTIEDTSSGQPTGTSEPLEPHDTASAEPYVWSGPQSSVKHGDVPAFTVGCDRTQYYTAESPIPPDDPGPYAFEITADDVAQVRESKAVLYELLDTPHPLAPEPGILERTGLLDPFVSYFIKPEFSGHYSVRLTPVNTDSGATGTPLTCSFEYLTLADLWVELLQSPEQTATADIIRVHLLRSDADLYAVPGDVCKCNHEELQTGAESEAGRLWFTDYTTGLVYGWGYGGAEQLLEPVTIAVQSVQTASLDDDDRPWPATVRVYYKGTRILDTELRLSEFETDILGTLHPDGTWVEDTDGTFRDTRTDCGG